MLYREGHVVGDRYEIESFVGEGGMQEVYLTTDKLLSRKVALKTPKNRAADKRFRRSAVTSAKVNHANVAKTLDYLREDSSQFLIEEFVEGIDLGLVLKQHSRFLDPMMTAKVFHRLAKGVAASHHASVVHRDLKPSNIMAVGGIRVHDVKITDFGIAKMAEEELEEAVQGGEESITSSQTAIGALPYMAPEMIQSVKEADRPADIWSLGAVIYEVLTGNKPFGVGYAAVPTILKGDIAQLPSFVVSNSQFAPAAKEIYEIVLECVQVKQEDRPTADRLVERCESLCYSIYPRERGVITSFTNGRWGFISPDQGDRVFFHLESVFGGQRVNEGDTVLFARHKGGGSDRAFPLIKI